MWWCPGWRRFLLLGLAVLPGARPQPQPVPIPAGQEGAVVPPVIHSPNPPGCAAEVMDVIYTGIAFTIKIEEEMVVCALQIAESEAGDNVTSRADPDLWPREKQRSCAGSILGIISIFSHVIGDFEAAMFDCFNINQGCGQSICTAMGSLLDSASTLVSVAGQCKEPGDVEATPQAGFLCWSRIWRVVQRLLRAAKFIDVALSLCPALPTPIDEVAPEPQPLNETASGGDETAPDPEPSAIELGSTGTWAALEPLPGGFAPVQPPAEASAEPAVERRLATGGGKGSDDVAAVERAETMQRRLMEIRDRFARAFGSFWRLIPVDDEAGAPEDLEGIKASVRDLTRRQRRLAAGLYV